MSIVFPNFFTYFCDILHNCDTFPCIQLIFQPEPFAEYRGSSRTHVRLGAWFWSAKADIFFSESLHSTLRFGRRKTIVSQTMCALAERLSQSEIVLPLRKTCYYSPLAEVGVFSTEINSPQITLYFYKYSITELFLTSYWDKIHQLILDKWPTSPQTESTRSHFSIYS